MQQVDVAACGIQRVVNLCRPRAGKRAPSRVGNGMGGQVVKKEKSFEEDFWENYRPPSYTTNKYVWAAALAVGSIAAYYSVYYKDCVPM